MLVTFVYCLFVVRETLAVPWCVRTMAPGLWSVSSPGEAAVAPPLLLPSTPVSPSSVVGSTRSSPPTKSSEEMAPPLGATHPAPSAWTMTENKKSENHRPCVFEFVSIKLNPLSYYSDVHLKAQG